jgi:hypothetical protein
MDGPVTSLESLLGSFDELDAWLVSMGVPARSTDRFHQLIELFRRLQPSQTGGTLPMTPQQQRLYMFALAEVMEFQQIFTWLRNDDPAVLGPKLIRALSGAADSADESPRNSDARNTIFELSLATEWRRAGLPVAIGDPDIRLTVGSQQLLVECKRPFGWAGTERCIKDATRQLRQNGSRQAPGAPKGIAAISLSRIIGANRGSFSARTMADKARLGEVMDCELIAHKHLWRGVRFDESIAGVLFHLSLPADVGGGEHFALLSFTNIYQASNNADALRLLNDVMEPLYEDAAPARSTK